MKTCTFCKTSKELAAFSKNKAAKDGLNIYCRPCHSKKTALNKLKNADSMKISAKKSRIKRSVSGKDWAGQLVRIYGITTQQYNSLFEIQKGKCAGCLRHQSALDRRLCLDHDHNTLAVRGLLCFECNKALTEAVAKPEVLMNLAFYLIKPTIDGLFVTGGK